VSLGPLWDPKRTLGPLQTSLVRFLTGATIGLLGLDRWARYRAVGTEDTAIARPRSQHRPAAAAFVEDPTGIARHRFRCAVSAVRAGDDGSIDHALAHGTARLERDRWVEPHLTNDRRCRCLDFLSDHFVDSRGYRIPAIVDDCAWGRLAFVADTLLLGSCPNIILYVTGS
jgi:hypothetical protein